MAKLTNIPVQTKGRRLSDKTTSPFIICFKYPLKKGYTFEDLSLAQVKQFQRFLDRAAQLTFQQVDEAYLRTPDKNDLFNGEQVLHYEVSEKFRIHGIIEQARFKVIRLDPNHRYHP